MTKIAMKKHAIPIAETNKAFGKLISSVASCGVFIEFSHAG